MLANISTRLRVEIGDNVLIGGFIVTGSEPKDVILRAIGPSLPVNGRLNDPQLELYDSTGQQIALNDNWRSSQEQEIVATGVPPDNDSEAAIVRSLTPGAYTAVVRGVNNTTGIALVELYDLNGADDSRFANISTRGFVQSGDNVLIGGIFITGTGTKTVAVRAIGPSLPVPARLEDPYLELHDGNGVLLQSNDNWRTDHEQEIIATTVAPKDDHESAIVSILAPGRYTAIVRGVGGGTGVGLVEVYGLN